MDFPEGDMEIGIFYFIKIRGASYLFGNKATQSMLHGLQLNESWDYKVRSKTKAKLGMDERTDPKTDVTLRALGSPSDESRSNMDESLLFE